MAAERTPPADWKVLRQNTRDRLWAPRNLLTTIERAVGEVLCRYAPNMFPAYERIAAEAGCSVRSVQKAMDVLCNGDPERDLPPFFVRRLRTAKLVSGRTKRHAGYEYGFIGSPEAFSRTRDHSGSISKPNAFVAQLPEADDRVSSPPPCADPEADDEKLTQRFLRWAKLKRHYKGRTELEIMRQVDEEFPELPPLVKTSGDD